MNNLSERIKELNKAKLYGDVILLNDSIKDKSNYNKWTYYYVIDAMYKLKKYNEVLYLGKECREKFGTDFSNVNNKIGWALYNLYIKDIDKNTKIEESFKVLDFIISNFKQEKFSPYEKSVNKVIKFLLDREDGKPINYNLINKYLDKLDPSLLSELENEINIDGETKKVASDREAWYGKKIKTLFNLERYEECLDKTEEAIENIKKFHNKGDLWIKYRQALCYIQLDDLEKSKNKLLEIENSLDHWCVFDKLYHIEKITGSYEEALRYASIAALKNNDHKMRIALYEDLGKYLSLNNLDLEAQYHYKLISLIRLEEEWKENKKIDDLITDKYVNSLNKKEIITYLKDFWKNKKYANVKFAKGKICKILNKDKNGFILGDDGITYYFIIKNFNQKVRNIKIGEKVNFIPSTGMDKKRHKVSYEAKDIEIIRK